MEITPGLGGATVRNTRMRLSSLLVAFALVAGSLLLIQQRADAAPAAVAAAVALPGAGAAQLGDLIQSIICPILLAVRNSFASGPFSDFVTPLISQFLVAFGCAPSG
jgi:hypothetical protein